MAKWITQFKLESKQLFGNWVFLLLPLLFGIWFISDLSQILEFSKQAIAPSQDLFMYTYSFHKIKHTLSLGLAILIGILFIRRDLVNPTYDWLSASPISSGTVLSAKYIAGILYLSLFTLSMCAVFVWFAMKRELAVSVLLKETAFFAVQYEVSYMVTLALAMFLAVWIKNRIVYLIGFCAWMFGTFFLDIFVISRFNLYFLKTFHLNQFMVDATEFFGNEAWGLSLLKDEVFFSRLFVIGFAIMLLTCMSAMLKTARPSESLKRWKMFSIVAIIIAAVLYVPYGQLWKERYDVYKNNVLTAPIINYNDDGNQEISFGEDEEFTVHDNKKFSVTSYDIDLKKDKQNWLTVTTDITVPTEAISKNEEIPFTLNRAFRVKSIEINGNSVNWKQSDDFVEIEQPSIDKNRGKQQIKISYEGELFLWSYRIDNYETFDGFVRDGNVYLPANIAWYPLPGHQYLYEKSFENELSCIDDASLLDKADFTIKAKGFKDKLFSTIGLSSMKTSVQMFAGKQLDGVDLFAGNFIELTSNNHELTLITTPSNKLEAKAFLDHAADAIDYFNTWIRKPVPHVKQVMYLPIFGYGLEGLHNETYMNTTSRHNNLDHYQRVKVISANLFGDEHLGTNPDETSVIYGIRQSFLYLYYRDRLQLSDDEIETTPNVIPFDFEDDDKNIDVFNMVKDAVSKGRTEKVKQVLNTFYDKGLTLKDIGDDKYSRITFEDWQTEWTKVMDDE
ncbi:hypothetical protein DCC39_12135 [Pueribacillus theae]|uniref:Uncharacterized protein n=1 Tax=Pueribacillus theae TaxID=2171751 RepID=A0A2U1JXT6_9BACI|nr:hypothetical protein [Pueribacillus theae]PWA10030.1 hypothetical protein DCC39_12135 [Pueribacillus theae]